MIKSKPISLNIMVLILISLFLFSSYAFPNDSPVLKNFEKVTVLENGRLKPIDTFARNILKELSAKSKLKKESAVEWLAKVLFDPSRSLEEKVFLVNNEEVLNSVGLFATRGRDRYSYLELSPFISKLRSLAISASKVEKRSTVEQEIITIYNKIYIYQGLTESFTFLIPNKNLDISDIDLKKELSLPQNITNFSFLDLALRSDKLRELTAAAEESKDKEKMDKLHKLIHSMQNITSYYSSLPLVIIPATKDKVSKWISPWNNVIDIFKSGSGDTRYINILKGISKSFREKKFTEFNNDLAEFNKLILSSVKTKDLGKKINTEVVYNKIDPFYKSEFFYGFSILFLLFSYIAFKKLNYYISFFLLLIGILPHSYGIIARMIIMGRPPVTNLYETFIFASWITVIIGIILEIAGKKNIGILTGSISGLILLIISGRYALEGDTMGMLVAVLDSNFWLATHVITITIGYGGIVISGALGHLYIFQRLFVKNEREKHLKDTFQSVYATQAFGLIFTFIGTVLGGIWADQSWGRFWGWDPKENGALLIVLWSVILFHSKLGKMVKETGFSIGAVIGIINVVLAWFGVNLLGVGLHSYGFSSNVAFSMIFYIALEILFIIGSILWFNRKKAS